MAALIQEHLDYKVGDRVWFVSTAEMGQGVVLDWKLVGLTGRVEYFVTFSPGMYYWLNGYELSTEKPIEI